MRQNRCYLLQHERQETALSLLFKKNDFNTSYKKRPFDSYKSIVDKLDEETKRKLDKQRTTGMVCVVIFVFLLIVILAVTGIGIDKNRSGSGNVFADKENVLIECFGDSITEGYTIVNDEEGEHSAVSEITYPQAMGASLMKLLDEDDKTWKCKHLDVKNYGISGSVLQKESSSRLSGNADIVLILYSANNFMFNEEYVGTLEANIGAIQQKGAQVFLLNYPTQEGSEYQTVHDQANNYIANTAKDLDIRLLDAAAYINELDQTSQEPVFCSDGVHLTAYGYEKMGDFVAEQLHQYYYDLY